MDERQDNKTDKSYQKLIKQLTMPALIIGVRKALTVLTMKHCRNTLILVENIAINIISDSPTPFSTLFLRTTEINFVTPLHL